jgi:hypothetical protein
MSKSNDFWEEPETLALLGLDEPRGKSDKFWDESERLLRRLDVEDMERRVDEIEELSADWTDWRGFPMRGFEAARYLTDEHRAYKQWYRGDSPEAARTRHIREGR